MAFRAIILLPAVFICQFCASQVSLSKIIVDKNIKDTFLFARQWDYPWETVKDEETGKFYKNVDGPLTSSDTAHLYFTANCQTNVQGGYTIRYCYASKRQDTTILAFADGLPAYASEFYIYITGDNFFFTPKTIYPASIPPKNISFEITRQKLILNKNSYRLSDLIMGYVDIEFSEQVIGPNMEPATRNYHLRGFIRTKLNGQ